MTRPPRWALPVALTAGLTLGLVTIPAPAAAREVSPTPSVLTARVWSPLRGLGAPPMSTLTPVTGTRWGWPINPRPVLLRVFDPPALRWGSGHRGIDLAAEVDATVVAVADGVVTHAGEIAGRGTVSILHADGVRSTYEPVTASVREGDLVTRGQPVGILSDPGGHCPTPACLHLGAKRGDTYLDPMLFLTRPRIVLLPPLP